MKKQKKASSITQMCESASKAHLQALFSAVENNHLEKARTILETSKVDLKCLNSDGFSVLDLSVLSNNRSMTKMLLSHGAHESQSKLSENVGNKLHKLLKIAETKAMHLKTNKSSNQPPSQSQSTPESTLEASSANIGTEVKECERRVKALRRLLLGWNQTEPPDVPTSFNIGVSGMKSVFVKILEPTNGSIATKFKVQWSCDSDFANLAGEYAFSNWNVISLTMGVKGNVNNLKSGVSYYFRASCGNMKGWGSFKQSFPSCVTISSWRDLNEGDEKQNQHSLDDLCTSLQVIRQKDLIDFTTSNSGTLKKPKRKNTLKNFFSYPFKFQKNLKRSIYFASVIYNEDKILVTSDDFLPVIEIDDSYPKAFASDYCWVIKVSHFWEGIKSLRADLEQHDSPQYTFRAKLLSSICEMQSALGLLNLGTLYYKPIRDQNGAIVITSIQNVQNPKTVSLLNSRWISIRKIQGSSSVSLEEHSISKKLILSLQDQIRFHQNLSQQLSPGLYVGYLNILCSVEQIKLIVPAQTPNVIPHRKVRDISYLTAEEWHLIKYGIKFNDKDSTAIAHANRMILTEVQTVFCSELINAMKKLFEFMDIKSVEHILHRIYDVEVVEFTNNISFIIICPTMELNSATLEAELLLQRDDLISVNINVFEMLHLYTYHFDSLHKYVKLNCILEVETILATRSHREAFSSSELQATKDKLNKLHELTAELNHVWNGMRWLMKVITFARNKKEQTSEFVKYMLGGICSSSEKCTDLKYIFQNISISKQQSRSRHFHTQTSVPESNFLRSQHKSLTSPQALYRNSVPGSFNKQVMQSINPTLNGGNTTSSSHLKICYPERYYSNGDNVAASENVNIIEPTTTQSQCNCRDSSATLETNNNFDANKGSTSFCNCQSYQNVENNGMNTFSAKNQTSGIIQVFTAYNTGLASGTSLKLHVTANTTAREVINLVVKQLNMAVILRGSKGPIHEMNKLHTFCLVAVIGARERCLRDDFKPLKLQNPWKKGRLYVRKKTDLLAAIEHYCQISYIH